MNLNVERILIIGLGMIGASIALASRSKGIKVTGYDIDSNSVKNAIQKQIIDDEASSIEQINSKKYTKDIDLIILAIPPKQTLDVLNSLQEVWNTDTTITETSSVKNHIKIKDVSNIVLSHPIAGSEASGPLNGNENLFANKWSVIIKQKRK